MSNLDRTVTVPFVDPIHHLFSHQRLAKLEARTCFECCTSHQPPFTAKPSWELLLTILVGLAVICPMQQQRQTATFWSAAAHATNGICPESSSLHQWTINDLLQYDGTVTTTRGPPHSTLTPKDDHPNQRRQRRWVTRGVVLRVSFGI